MQSNRFLIAFVVGLLSLSFVQTADAQRRGGGEGGLINKLSGPGPFETYGFFFTFSAPLPGVFTEDEATTKQLKQQGIDVLPEIPVWAGVEILRAVGTGNDLQYADDVEGSRQVNFWTIEPTLDWRVSPKIPIEFGVGLGLHFFSGEVFDSFFRASLGPRIGLRMPFGGRYSKWQNLRVQYQILFAFGGFDAEDFGAIPGTFESAAGEISFAFLVSYDFSY